MENTKIQSALENLIAEQTQIDLRELNEAQLALVGGGTAEVTLI